MIVTDLLYIFIAFASATIVGIVLYSWILKHADDKNLILFEKSNIAHKSSVLQLGGLVLIPCVIVGICLSMVLMSKEGSVASSIKTSTLLLGCGVMSVYLVGLLNDFYGLSVNVRLTIQTLAALTLPLCGLVFTDLHGIVGITTMPLWISYPLTIVIIVAVINAVNTIDGVDGFLPLYAILCMLCFGVCFYDSGNMVYCLIAASMIGGLLVFLCYNMLGGLKNKYTIHMGDSGSMILGFSLAYLTLKFIIAEDKSSLDQTERMLICYSLLFIPCMDIARVFFERILHGDIPFFCDQRHLHHLIIKAGIFGRMTLLAMLCIILFFLLINIILVSEGCTTIGIMMIDILCYAIIVGVIKHRIRIFNERIALLDNIEERFRQNALSAQKICILTPRFPVPENGGDVLRINNIARQLKREGYQLVLLTFEEDGAPQIFEAERIYDKVYTVHRSKLNSLWQSFVHMLSGRAMQCGYYYSGKYKRKLRHVMETEKPDLFIAHLLRMMPYLDEANLHDRSIIEMTDALSKTYSLSSDSKGGGILKYIYSIEKHLIRRSEQYSMLFFPKNVLVSKSDTDYLATLSSHASRLKVLTNGVDMLPFIPKGYNHDKIVFVGNMRTLQNKDAVLFFVHDIFPRILRKRPNAVFYIVGAQPPREIMELASKNIIVTGFVDNLASTISDAAVAVAPVRVAAGIQNKVLVAMGCGIPVVLTTLISQAIPELEDEHNCIIRDEAPTIAEACLRLMNHPEYRASISKSGYDMVRHHYGWEEKLKGYVIEK